MSLAFQIEVGRSRIVAALSWAAHAAAAGGVLLAGWSLVEHGLRGERNSLTPWPAGDGDVAAGQALASALLALVPLLALAIASALVRLRRSSRLRRGGRLLVDRSGAGTWQSPSSPGSAPPGPRRLRVDRFWCGEHVAWLRVRCEEGARPGARGGTPARTVGEPFDLLLGRDCASEDQWRTLRAWLVWLERGPRA